MNLSNYKLDYLREKYRLSARAYNACKANGLTDLECLMIYYHKHKNFTSLTNCGTMSDFELKRLCERFAISK
jgi:hypothetical protein